MLRVGSKKYYPHTIQLNTTDEMILQILCARGVKIINIFRAGERALMTKEDNEKFNKEIKTSM